MSNPMLSPDVIRDVHQFFTALSIRTITLGANTCIKNREPVTDVIVQCVSDGGSEYTVSFKLQTICADMFRYLMKIETAQEIKVTFTQAALDMATEERQTLLDRFLRTINHRIRAAKKEQEIQSIKYLGNTFELNKKTVFKVTSDDGEGHLGIEILGNPVSQELKLSSHDLLDGLYSGAIRQLQVG